MPAILLLTASNIFMTLAWYGHLKFTGKPLWIVVMVSWGIAFFEYWLAVPANRIGYLSGFSAGQPKVMQEVISLLVFGSSRWWCWARSCAGTTPGPSSAWSAPRCSCSLTS